MLHKQLPLKFKPELLQRIEDTNVHGRNVVQPLMATILRIAQMLGSVSDLHCEMFFIS